jgi:AcrR family transcriptional regulator
MPKIVNKQIKSQEIGRAALGVFRKYGYHRTTMADIANAASVGKGIKEGAVQVMAKATIPGERLTALVEFALDHVAEWEDHCSIYVEYLGVAKREQKGSLSMDRFYEEFRAILKLLIEESQIKSQLRQEFDPEITAELLLALFDGVVLHGIFVERSYDADSIRSTALKLVTYGLFKEK